MALVTQSVMVVLLCALSQCSAAGTVSISSGSASQMVMEAGTLSVCVEVTLDPGNRVEVELSITPAGEQFWMLMVTPLSIDYQCRRTCCSYKHIAVSAEWYKQ